MALASLVCVAWVVPSLAPVVLAASLLAGSVTASLLASDALVTASVAPAELASPLDPALPWSGSPGPQAARMTMRRQGAGRRGMAITLAAGSAADKRLVVAFAFSSGVEEPGDGYCDLVIADAATAESAAR